MMLRWVLHAGGEHVRDLVSDPLGSNLAIFLLGDSDPLTCPSLSGFCSATKTGLFLLLFRGWWGCGGGEI